jgi:oxygen-independent coproporphyrinogen-3 oxidase
MLARVIDAVRHSFELTPGAEVTCEANPGTSDRERFAALRDHGVTRLSLGVQSLCDDELRWLGRSHSAEQARQAYAAARKAGFADISLDLIYGLPGQTEERWRRTLSEAIALSPEHLSLYALTVEPGTPLAGRIAEGSFEAPDDDRAADAYEMAEELLAREGFRHYEISNWALPGHKCRHNLVYWRDEEYFGFGAGAHGYHSGRRAWNVSGVQEYIRRIERRESAEGGHELIDGRTEMAELMMLGLRLLDEGVSEQRFRSRFGIGLVDAFGAAIGQLCQRGLIEQTGDTLRLTPRAHLLGNQVFAEFLP